MAGARDGLTEIASAIGDHERPRCERAPASLSWRFDGSRRPTFCDFASSNEVGPRSRRGQGAFELVINRLADVVQQGGSGWRPRYRPRAREARMRAIWATSTECFSWFWPSARCGTSGGPGA